MKDLIKENKCLKSQKVTAKLILHYSTDQQIKIIENCLDIAFLEGMKVGMEVGMEEASKIHAETYK